jgi:hypothetical protein
MINWEGTQLKDCEFSALVSEGLDHVMLRVCLTVCQLCEDFFNHDILPDETDE